jgi:hypothetical protein
MYDYVKSRPAKVGEKLRTHRFHPGIIGFAAPEDASTAVRVLSGTELAFATTIRCSPRSLFGWKVIVLNHTTATFREPDKDNQRTHDALEFPNGQKVLLTYLLEGQEATVLQLPAQPVTAAETKGQKRIRNVRWFAKVSVGRFMLEAASFFGMALLSCQFSMAARDNRPTEWWELAHAR